MVFHDLVNVMLCNVPICRNVNDDIMELMLMAYACRTSSARNIVGVIPYLPYCKQSKMRKRGSIVSRLLADLFTKAGRVYMPLIAMYKGLSTTVCCLHIPLSLLYEHHCTI